MILNIHELHKKYDFHKLLLIVLSLSNFGYLLYLLLIAYHNIIISDDYWFMAEYKKYGIVNSLSWWYENWQGRFSAQLLINIVVKSYELMNSLLPYTILLISFFIYAIGNLLKIILPCPAEPIRHYQLLIFNISFFLFNLFLIVNFEFSTFYWITVSAMYFGGIVFAIMGFTELINPSNSLVSYFLLFLGFTYAGSSSEHFGAMCTLLLGLYLAWNLYQQKRNLNKSFNNRLLFKSFCSLIFCLVSFLIMILAPGNEVRRGGYAVTSVFDASLISIKSLFYLLTVLISEKAKYLLILSFPFIYFGTLFRGKNLIDEYKTSLFIAVSLPLFIVLLYICLLPLAYAVSGIGPFRALTHIAFLLVIYIAFLSFLIGYKTLFSKKLAFAFAVFSCIFLMIIARDRLVINLPETIKYTNSEKKRVTKLLTLKSQGNKAPVTLDSLYKSSKNVLFYYEIEKDSVKSSNYWINRCISDGLELGFRINVQAR